MSSSATGRAASAKSTVQRNEHAGRAWIERSREYVVGTRVDQEDRDRTVCQYRFCHTSVQQVVDSGSAVGSHNNGVCVDRRYRLKELRGWVAIWCGGRHRYTCSHLRGCRGEVLFCLAHGAEASEFPIETV